MQDLAGVVEHLKNHNEPQPHKHYAKTKAEKRVDFATVEKTLDKLDNDFEQSVITVMTKQMEAVKTYIKNKMTKNEFDFTAIDNLDLKFKSELIQKFEDGYANAYSVGKKEARDSLPKKFLKTQIGVGILTAGFKRYFKSKARLDVKKISATLTNDMMGILLNSLTRGTSIPKTTIAIQQGFNPYIADGTEISYRSR